MNRAQQQAGQGCARKAPAHVSTLALESTSSHMDHALTTWLSSNVTWAAGKVSRIDLDLVKRLVVHGVTDLSLEFAAVGGGELLSDIRLTVRLHNGDSAEACMRTNASGTFAELELLAPSIQPSDARTIIGEPKDSIYIHKTVVHELSMLFLWQVTRRKPSGWGFFSGPDWFVDGWEEYLSLIRSSEHSRNTSLRLYRERVKVRWKSAAPAKLNRYLDGAIILQFMYDRFGRDRMFKLLRAPENTFAEALKATLECDETSLFASFQQWLTD